MARPLATNLEFFEKVGDNFEKSWQNPVFGGYASSSCGTRVNPISGKKEFHNGVDIAVETGTNAAAIADGTVTDCGYSPSWGNFVKYKISDSYEVFYAHLDEVLTSVGSEVKQGDVLAKTGNTGYSTGAHLHLTLFKNGKEIDPLPFFDYKASDSVKSEYIARGEAPPAK